MPGTSRQDLLGFINEHAAKTAKIFTDENRGYASLWMDFDHTILHHKSGEFVKGDVSTQGIESFWAMLKRAHKGTFHKLSPKHLDRYVQEFAGRHNMRELDTLDQMATIAKNMVGKRLLYRELVR